MSTKMNHRDPPEQADHEAVMKHAIDGTPLDPEVACRVEERAAKITEEIYRIHGPIDDETIHKLLRGDDNA